MEDSAGGQSQDLGSEVRLILGREVVLDREGFFREYEDWFPEAAEVLAAEAGLPLLTEKHWRVINFFRSFYEYNGRAPLNKQIKDGAAMSIQELQGLFPDGIKNGARRLAGLPNPKTCE